MNTTTKIILTDTNILTDLFNAGILNTFIELENLYISDIVKAEEIRNSTGDVSIINRIKELESTQEQIVESKEISKQFPKLSVFDCNNFVLARDNDAILATGDKRLHNLCEKNDVEVIRTLRIIDYMNKNGYISKEQTLQALIKLKNNEKTRIPISSIDQMITDIKNN